MTVGRRARRAAVLGLRAAAVVSALALVGAPSAVASPADSAAPNDVSRSSASDLIVPVGAEPDGSKVSLDASIYTPSSGGKHPAVLLAHGFGGSKASVAKQAEQLAEDGFVVLTWSARGFGNSSGKIHLNDPKFEVADGSALIDVLARRDDVRLDAANDPRVAVVGSSYGGALALMLAANDPRVDTNVAGVTWHDLGQAFFPQHATTGDATDAPAQLNSTTTPGPFQQLWASSFFATAMPLPQGRGTSCGQFDPDLCAAILPAVQTGQPSAAAMELLRSHSPVVTNDKLKTPTYLIQGMSDSLFGLDQADATAATLSKRKVPVAVRWIDGGHDGPSSTQQADEDSVTAWLKHYLNSDDGDTTGATGQSATTLPVPAFSYALPLANGQQEATMASADSYTGSVTGSATVPFAEPVKGSLSNPPGGQPASLTSLPGGLSGLGAATNAVSTYPLAALPGQSWAATTAPIESDLSVVGPPRITVKVTSSSDEVILYASLWQTAQNGPRLPRTLVAPIRIPVTPGKPQQVTISLPAATWEMTQGSTWRVLLTTTNAAYTPSTAARVDQVEVIGGLTVPVADTAAAAQAAAPVDSEVRGLLAALSALVIALIVGAIVRARRRQQSRAAEHQASADTGDPAPLVVSGLVKTYADGHRAVDDVSWRAEPGQVVGLLGPNGAGKTTTIRMILGLIAPDEGCSMVRGEVITPGAPVLDHVGALVEGPGFLPHLTGRQNLLAYWQATGRPIEQAYLEEAIDVAALGGALERKVSTYSHGMKQRLGIAQAMLGLPDLLILDEPTNGLDPPQIAALRPILKEYAAGGRTVVISSHLLAEVEMTCSHVVVMHAGAVAATGAVDELVAGDGSTVVDLIDPTSARARKGTAADVAAKLAQVPGITNVATEASAAGHQLHISSTIPRAEVIRAVLDAGGRIDRVDTRRPLEEVFLGVISEASGVDPHQGSDSLTDRLRQVRPR